MLRLDHISKVFPNGEALRDICWEVKAGERLGLVGANGTGKTTQFRIITGEIEPSSGDVIKQPGIRIAYLSQEFDIVQGNTVHEELLRAFSEVHEIKQEMHHVQVALETADEQEMTRLLRQLERLQHDFESRDGYGLELRVDKILPEIGFTLKDAERLVSEFSGGWQMRIGLGKVMLQEPHVLLLDEPTNHIDLETIEWLEGYLRGLSTPMVIVSHDRFFLDRICTNIVEIERGVSTSYLGNYSTYLEQKQINREAQEATFERQQKELERQQEFIDRFRASANRSTQAKSRERQLEKWDLVEAPESEERTLRFRFPPCVRSGREVAIIKDLTHVYDDNVIFLGANLLLERGDRVALLGPNGAGKSTLLRLLMGSETPSEGSITLGSHNIVPAYFEQNQAEALDLTKTVLQTIAEQVPQWKDSEIRGLLGRFLFSDDTVFKRVGELSGGEKARLALAKMMTRSANFLILDEPTNHLDIPAKEMIEEALNEYEGTVILVSHDRHFISKIANKIVEIVDGTLKLCPGDYEYYLEVKAREKQQLQEAKEAAAREKELAEKRAKAKEKEKARKAKKAAEKANDDDEE
ncbi:MAG: ATP-binding cassette domain-containing protein [Candidatus Obscuribacterales bacterium]|nr:ATP-binding cassette domain-containing protein [Candidatus Obscuribacterales bacterium]